MSSQENTTPRKKMKTENNCSPLKTEIDSPFKNLKTSSPFKSELGSPYKTGLGSPFTTELSSPYKTEPDNGYYVKHEQEEIIHLD